MALALEELNYLVERAEMTIFEKKSMTTVIRTLLWGRYLASCRTGIHSAVVSAKTAIVQAVGTLELQHKKKSQFVRLAS